MYNQWEKENGQREGLRCRVCEMLDLLPRKHFSLLINAFKIRNSFSSSAYQLTQLFQQKCQLPITKQTKNGIDLHLQECTYMLEREKGGRACTLAILFSSKALFPPFHPCPTPRYMRLSWEILSCHLGELLTVINRYPQCARARFLCGVRVPGSYTYTPPGSKYRFSHRNSVRRHTFMYLLHV